MLKKLLALSFCMLPASFGLHAQNAGSENWYFEDFETLGILGPTLPDGWTQGSNSFSVNLSGGVDGSQAIYAQCANSNERWVATQAFDMGDNPVVEYYFKTTGVIGDAPANGLATALKVSTDNGTTWTVVDTVAYADYQASSTYALKRVTLPDTYKDQSCMVKLSVYGNSELGTSSFYVDNFGMGTPAEVLENDLMISGTLSGPSNPALGMESLYSVNVLNNGSTAQSDYSVKLKDAQGNELCTVDGTELQPAAQQTFELAWTPQAAGTFRILAEVELEGDANLANNISDTLDVEVLESGVAIEVGQGTNKTYHPVSFTSDRFGSQNLFLAEELNFTQGKINAIAFEGTFVQELSSNVTVMIGETDSTGFYVDENFAWHMIPWDHFTTVFRGEKTFPQGENVQIRFDFTEEFDYTGGNLVVFLVNDNETAYPSMDESGWFFGTYELGDVVSLGAFDIDLANPANDAVTNFSRPNTTFFFSEVSDASYNLTFNITDIAGNTVSDAVVKLNGTEYEAGQYTFEDLKPGSYPYTVTKNTATASGTAQIINEDVNIDVTLLDFSEIPGASGFLCEDFENIAPGSRPFGWNGDFYVYVDGGIENGKRLSHSFWYLDGSRNIYTNPVFMGDNPVFEFQYRIMEMEIQNLTYTGNACPGTGVMWQLSVSTDQGETWTQLHSVGYSEHMPSTDYQTFSLDVSQYANELCMFHLHVERDNSSPESFYFDIDNWSIGTQPEFDLSVLSPIAGNRVASVNEESLFTVQVKNSGKQNISSYTLKLMKGDTEIASVNGSELEAGAWKEHELAYTPISEGNEILYAVVETENDTYMANNTTTNLYVSVQPEGTRGEMVEDMEGRDICYVPFYFYTPYALNQTLYFSDETGLEAGEALTGIVYQTAFSKPLERQRVSVYVGETDQESLFLGSGAGMLPMDGMRLVFDGAIDISDVDGDNLAIEFQTPYQYGGKNLVVCTYQQSGQAAGSESDQLAFYGYYTLDRPVSSTYAQLDNPIDMNNLPSSVLSNFSYPSTIFLSREGVEFHTVTFEVKDTEGRTIDNAVITFNGMEMETGTYTVADVPDGVYPWSASWQDQTREGDVEVSGGDASVQVVFEPVSNEFNVEEDMIKVYPNPSTGKFYVEHAQFCKEIGIYDISGREVRRYTKVDAGVLEIDLSGCRDGLYLLMVDGKAFKITKR